MPVPDVSAVSPQLIGPILDRMTFHVDAHPSLREGELAAAGHRVRSRIRRLIELRALAGSG